MLVAELHFSSTQSELCITTNVVCNTTRSLRWTVRSSREHFKPLSGQIVQVCGLKRTSYLFAQTKCYLHSTNRKGSPYLRGFQMYWLLGLLRLAVEILSHSIILDHNWQRKNGECADGCDLLVPNLGLVVSVRFLPQWTTSAYCRWVIISLQCSVAILLPLTPIIQLRRKGVSGITTWRMRFILRGEYSFINS